MKWKFCVQRLSALFIALLFIPLLISGSDIRSENNDHTGAHSTNRLITCSAYRFAEIICAEELLSPNTAKITRYDTSKKLNHPRFFEHFFKNSLFLLFAACILFLTLFFVNRIIFGSQRFIIKYIHDQDGYKL